MASLVLQDSEFNQPLIIQFLRQDPRLILRKETSPQRAAITDKHFSSSADGSFSLTPTMHVHPDQISHYRIKLTHAQFAHTH